MEELHQMKCEACRAGAPAVTQEEMDRYGPQVPDWRVMVHEGIRHLERVFKFRDFRQALAFTNGIGELAEVEGHHPAILTEWGKVTVRWWTHKIGGLHRNDFVMAAKTDRLYAEPSA